MRFSGPGLFFVRIYDYVFNLLLLVYSDTISLFQTFVVVCVFSGDYPPRLCELLDWISTLVHSILIYIPFFLCHEAVMIFSLSIVYPNVYPLLDGTEANELAFTYFQQSHPRVATSAMLTY